MACAIFKVDSKARLGVRWKLTPMKAEPSISVGQGFPLGPGMAFSVAGEGTIRNSKFVLDGSGVLSVRGYAIYFDRVDVVASEFADHGSTRTVEALLEQMAQSQEEMLIELRRHTDALQEASGRELEPIR